MSRDRGRLVEHFGKTYMWIINGRGRLELVALSTITETVGAATGALRRLALSGQQPDTWAVTR